jgi:hypothetical protein
MQPPAILLSKSMKNAKQYSALIAEGYSEKAAARITNTPTKGSRNNNLPI